MDKDNTKTTINELLKVIDEKKFAKLVNIIDIDKYVKKLTVVLISLLRKLRISIGIAGRLKPSLNR